MSTLSLRKQLPKPEHPLPSPADLHRASVWVSAMPYAYSSDDYDPDEAGAGWSTIFPNVDDLDVAELFALADAEDWTYGDSFPAREWLGEDEEPTGDAPAWDEELDDWEDPEDWAERVRDWIRERMSDSPDYMVPMMSYFWPLPEMDSPEHAQTELALHGGAVCIVRVGDQYGLALTGGGMDLSQDLAEGYALCGYLPPLELARSVTVHANRGPEWLAWFRSVLREAGETAEAWGRQAIEHAERLGA